MRFSLRARLALLTAVLTCFVPAAYTQTTPSVAGTEILAHTAEATVLVLTGIGAGRLQGIGTGIAVRSDGVILTAYHVVKNAREVQIRLKNGDVYDQVRLIGFDERRDVAALKIAAHNLPVLPVSQAQDTKIGASVYAVTNADGLTWSATSGISSAFRAAGEVSGAGSGYHVLQFTAPVARDRAAERLWIATAS